VKKPDIVTPSALEAERRILSAIMRDRNMFDTVCGLGITEKSFCSAKYRDVFTAMLGAAKDMKPVNDEIELANRCKCNDIADIASLYDAISTTSFVANWAEELKRKEAERAIVSGAQDIVSRIVNRDSLTDVLQAAENHILNARQIAGGDEHRPLIYIGKELHEQLEHPPIILPLFPKNTDAGEAIQVHAGELMVIGARTGSGKTALAAQMAYNALINGMNVMYVCVESSSADIFARIVSAACGVPHFSMINGEVSDDEKMKFNGTFLTILHRYANNLAIIGCDRKVITAERIIHSLRSWAIRVGHVDLVVVDFLQGMSFVRGQGDRRTRIEMLDDSIMSLHDAFIEQKCAGILLSQFNREMQKVKAGEVAQMPDLTWLKETSTLEQLAHTVAFLHKPDKEINETFFYSRKTRNQKPFNVKLSWHGAGYVSASRF